MSKLTDYIQSLADCVAESKVDVAKIDEQIALFKDILRSYRHNLELRKETVGAINNLIEDRGIARQKQTFWELTLEEQRKKVL